MEQQLALERPDPIPAEVSSSQAKLVYLYVDVTGGATVDELNDALSLTKLTVLSVLHSLSGRGLIRREDGTYVTVD